MCEGCELEPLLGVNVSSSPFNTAKSPKMGIMPFCGHDFMGPTNVQTTTMADKMADSLPFVNTSLHCFLKLSESGVFYVMEIEWRGNICL